MGLSEMGSASADSKASYTDAAADDNHASSVPKSPRWTTPAEVMKARQIRLSRKRNAAASCQKPQDFEIRPSDGDIVIGSPPLKVSARRVNPFGSLPSSAKRRLVSGAAFAETENVTTNGNSSSATAAGFSGTPSSQLPAQPSMLLRRLGGLTSATVDPAPSDKLVSHETVAAPSDVLEVTQLSQPATCKAYSPFGSGGETAFRECGRAVPADWSPKLRVRLISPAPFVCCSALPRSQEKSAAVIAAASGALSCDSSDSLCQSPATKLQRALLYWCYPSVPGCDVSAWTGQSNKESATVSLHKNVKSAIRDVWTSSLESAYDLVKNAAMPYFYVVAQSFIVLFRAGDTPAVSIATPPGSSNRSSSSSSELTAVLTPTTAGLRQALNAAGVQFTTREQLLREEADAAQSVHPSGLSLGDLSGPTVGEDCKVTGQSLLDDLKADQCEDDDPLADDCSYDQWLESLGVSKDSLPGLENSSMRQRLQETQKSVDGRPGSTISVRGTASVHSLFNFLLNYAGCVPATGPLAGLPPAIVAPGPFLHGTMQQLKCSHVKLHLQDGTLVPQSGPSIASQPAPTTTAQRKQQRRRLPAANSSSSGYESWLLDVDGGPVLPAAVVQLLQLAELQERCYVRLGSSAASAAIGSGRCWDALNISSPKPVTDAAAVGGAAVRNAATERAASVASSRPLQDCPSSRPLRELSYSNGQWHWNSP